MTIQLVPSFGVGDAKDFRAILLEASRDQAAVIGEDFGELYLLKHDAVRAGLTDKRFTA